MKRTRSVTAPKKQKFLSYLRLVSLQIPFPQLCWSLPLSGPGSCQSLTSSHFCFRELGTGPGTKVKPHHIAHHTALPSSSSPQSAENWGDYYLGLMRGSLIPLGRGSPSNDSPRVKVLFALKTIKARPCGWVFPSFNGCSQGISGVSCFVTAGIMGSTTKRTFLWCR